MASAVQHLESDLRFECMVLSHTLLTRTLHKILITKPKLFEYKAGNYIKIYLKDNTYRLYSIANTPHHPYIELHIQEPSQDNYIKNFLRTLKTNENIFISDSMGNLVYPPKINQATLFVAGGYAFAPFKAIIESLCIEGGVTFPIFLYWGISNISDAYYQNELQKIKRDVEWFDFKVILSKSATKWKGDSGNLLDFIFYDDNNLDRHNMYVCGSMSMVSTIYHKALRHNLLPSNFYSDYDLTT